MPELQRPTVTLHYEDSGTSIPGKPALVFLHGWCDGSASWADTIAVLAGDFRCIAPDMRGHGRSGLPRDHAYGAEALSNDVVALCEALDIEHPVLVGHSFGGYLAGEVARRFPGFARAIVVEDQPLDLREFGEQMRSLESVIRSPDMHMAFRTQLFDSMVTEKMPPEGRSLITKMKDTTPIEVGQALWAALFEFTPAELAARSDALMEALAAHPSLSIDHEEPPVYYETLHWFAPNAHTTVIESGHWIHLERPAEFRAALREFLAGV